MGNKRSKRFEIEKEIKQDYNLSPLLFILIMNKMTKWAKTPTYTNLPPFKVGEFTYVEDKPLWVKTQNKLQKLTELSIEEI